MRRRAISFSLILLTTSFLTPFISGSHADTGQTQQLLDSINQRMPAVDHLDGEFTQTKTLTVLPQPLRSSGEFRFDSDSGLRWQVLEPIASLLVFNSKGMTQQQDGNTLWAIGADQPTVMVIGRIISALLVGDWALLDSYFNIDGELFADHWQLQLTPRNSTLQSLLQRIDLRGQQTVQALTLLEPNGDSTAIDFSIPSRTD